MRKAPSTLVLWILRSQYAIPCLMGLLTRSTDVFVCTHSWVGAVSFIPWYAYVEEGLWAPHRGWPLFKLCGLGLHRQLKRCQCAMGRGMICPLAECAKGCRHCCVGQGWQKSGGLAPVHSTQWLGWWLPAFWRYDCTPATRSLHDGVLLAK